MLKLIGIICYLSIGYKLIISNSIERFHELLLNIFVGFARFIQVGADALYAIRADLQKRLAEMSA